MNSEDILSKLIIALNDNNIDVDWETMEIIDNNLNTAIDELFNAYGTCPYFEKKCKICSDCGDDCGHSSLKCWKKYISKTSNC